MFSLWVMFDSVYCNPPGSSVHEISQARILEWVAISFSRDLRNLGIELMYPAFAEVLKLIKAAMEIAHYISFHVVPASFCDNCIR